MKIIFVGNCQIAVLFELFRLFSETALDDQMSYLPSYENLSAEGQKDLQQAGDMEGAERAWHIAAALKARVAKAANCRPYPDVELPLCP